MRVNTKQLDRRELAAYDLFDEVNPAENQVRWLFRDISNIEKKVIRLRFRFYCRTIKKGLKSFKQIAVLLGKPEGTVRQLCHRAIYKMRRVERQKLD